MNPQTAVNKMPLHKIKDFNPEYKKHFNNNEIKGVGLYSGNEKIGTIDDILVTDEGKFRYFVIDTGGWILGKKVLLPIGHTRLDKDFQRVDADNLTKRVFEKLFLTPVVGLNPPKSPLKRGIL